MKSTMLVKKFLGLVEMTSGQVDATILDKINGKPGRHPPPQIKDGKMTGFFPFYCVQDCSFSFPEWQAVKMILLAPLLLLFF